MPKGIYERKPFTKRFWSKVKKDPNGCWNWTAHKNMWGYPIFWFNGKNIMAHRFSYEMTKGNIPVGLFLDHLCRNRECVNPDHLEPVSTRENILRGETPASRNHRKTKCMRGHPLLPIVTGKYRNMSWRYCPICHKKSVREYFLSHKDKVNECRRIRRAKQKALGLKCE